MSDSPTILQLNTVASPYSGVGRIMHGIDHRLKALGIRSVMVAGYGSKAYSDYVLESQMQYVLNALRARVFGNDVFLGAGLVGKLHDILMHERPALVHIHNLHGYYMDVPALSDLLYDMDIPVVITAHDYRMFTGRCASPFRCDKWISHSCDVCPFPQYYPAVLSGREPRYMMEYLGRLNAHIVVASEAMADLVKRSTLAHLPLSVIPNGVDNTIFNPHSKERIYPEDVVLIAVAAKWTSLKNPEALSFLAQSMPRSWTMVVVGNGAKQYFKGNKGNVVFVSHIKDSAALASLYRSADVLLSASYSETFGMTIHEAAACGVPSVVNHSGAVGVPTASVSADFNDVPGLIKTIKKALTQKVNPSAVTTIHEMAEKYLNLYSQLVSV